jgi:hypothetical protein
MRGDAGTHGSSSKNGDTANWLHAISPVAKFTALNTAWTVEPIQSRDTSFISGAVMHIHVRIHHWVFWWFYVGIVLGAIALVNILFRDLSRGQERTILIVGVMHWLLGGLVCYSCEGIQIERPRNLPRNDDSAAWRREGRSQMEWHGCAT